MECVDLRQRFGKKHRVRFEESHEGTTGKGADPWTMEMPCQGKGVTIYPFGGKMLAVEINNRPILAKRVAALPDVTCRQDGQHEKTFLFHVDQFDQVSELVRPRKRRSMTPEQKEVAAAQLAPYHFPRGPERRN